MPGHFSGERKLLAVHLQESVATFPSRVRLRRPRASPPAPVTDAMREVMDTVGEGKCRAFCRLAILGTGRNEKQRNKHGLARSAEKIPADRLGLLHLTIQNKTGGVKDRRVEQHGFCSSLSLSLFHQPAGRAGGPMKKAGTI